MSNKTIQINNKTLEIDDILEISEFVNEEQNNLLPYGYSIILKDFSTINVLNIPEREHDNKKHQEIFTLYSIIKNHLTKNINIREDIKKGMKCV